MSARNVGMYSAYADALEPMRLEPVEVIYRPDGTVWVRHMDGAMFGPFDSIVDAVEAGVA